MQITLQDDVESKKRELEEKKREQQKEWDERNEKERYFKKHFRYGSTTVLKYQGQFFFKGDISHCSTENIFHNARAMKAMMEKNGQTRGYMNYNDPPTFDSRWTWDEEEKERKQVYEDDLYKFVGDTIVVAELIGKEPIGHIYKDTTADEGFRGD